MRGHGGASVVRKSVRYIVDSETGCWLWQLKTRDGYGIEKVNNKVTSAHINYYEAVHGKIPDGFVIDHLCKTRGCVNPDHLEAVTTKVNSRRGTNAKTTSDTVDNLRSLFKQGYHSPVELAKIFGLSLSCVCDILMNKTWV